MDAYDRDYFSTDPNKSEERARDYNTGNMERGGYMKKSGKGKKSKRRNTRRRGRRSRKHRMR
jgi:hypothetical protein